MGKKTKGTSKKEKRSRGEPSKETTDAQYPVWNFRDIERDGKFAFDVNRKDFKHKEILEKIISYSSMTWFAIQQYDNDKGHGRNHYLSIDSETLTKEAMECIRRKIPDESDPRWSSIFSFSLNNKMRIIGVRMGAEFRVIWYDPDHEFAKTSKKHT